MLPQPSDFERHPNLESPSPDSMETVYTRRTGIYAEYSLRAPSPPHIYIPPGPEDLQLYRPAYEKYLGDNASKGTLWNILQDVKPVRMEDWKYESRRQIQRVLPFLYLGPFIALKNYEFLRNEGITLLLVIRDTMIATARILSGNKAAKELGIEALAVDVSGNQQLIAAFPRAIKTINDHLISKYESKPVDGEPLGPNSRMITRGKVLVFCESGNERSATVIAAYIMAMYNVDMVTAVQYLQSARFCVAIDDALKHLLLTHQEILEAQKATQTPDNQFSSRIILKRGRDDMDEDVEMNEDHGDGNERFSGRHGFQPFHDG